MKRAAKKIGVKGIRLVGQETAFRVLDRQALEFFQEHICDFVIESIHGVFQCSIVNNYRCLR